MKKVDDTPVPENESEPGVWEVFAAIKTTMLTYRHRILALEKRIANLETQRTPQDENDDPEWY